MTAHLSRPLSWLSAWFCAGTVLATTVRIENTAGRIDVRTVMGAEGVHLHVSSPTRDLRPADVYRSSTPGQILIRCQPTDGARIDIEVSLPHTVRLEAKTAGGPISVTGLLLDANLMTETGDLRIATPWELMRLRVLSQKEPRNVLSPKIAGVQFSEGWKDQYWALANSRADTRARFGDPIIAGWRGVWEGVFGSFQIEATAPGQLELVDLPVPKDSWVRLPSEAQSVLESIRKPVRRPKPATEAGSPPPSPPPRGERGDEPVFSSDVRLVTLSIPVYDRQGHPVPGLAPGDFEVLEDGAPQKVAFARSEEAPFNLVLLLDLSKSTVNSRALMMRAARNFVEITRPHDRIAIYALANTVFHVVSPLTTDRKRVLELTESIPDITGGTPLYDALVLSCAQESLYRLPDRSAIIVLSDGMDNQFEAPGRGSKVSFARLREAVAEWPVMIYSIFLPYESPVRQKPARKRMEQLAEASGGRLFEASSIQKLEPVYARVADELRSVYAIGYYPRNQDFNGGWRGIRVRMKRPGLVARTRRGYYAW